MINWHRLFGLTLTDYFTGSPYDVKLEMDLSLKQQFLDVVIVRRTAEGSTGPLPDGLDNLAEHNLLSYKSLREPLDDTTSDELVGHFVNYRKQVTPADAPLVPKSVCRLYGVSTRFPAKLHRQVPLKRLQEGVHEVFWGNNPIRVIVLSEIPEAPHNALWNLFSGVVERAAYGVSHYRPQLRDASTILNQLYHYYELEGMRMPYTLEDFRREYADEIEEDIRKLVQHLSPEHRLEGLSPEQRLQGLSPKELLQRLSPGQRLEGLSPKELLQQLSPDEIRAYLDSLERNSDKP